MHLEVRGPLIVLESISVKRMSRLTGFGVQFRERKFFKKLYWSSDPCEVGELTCFWIKVAKKSQSGEHTEKLMSIQHWDRYRCPAFQKGVLIRPVWQQEPSKPLEGTWEALGRWWVKKAETSSKWVPAWARVCLSCPSEVGANILNGFEWFRMFLSPHTRTYDWNPFRWGL